MTFNNNINPLWSSGTVNGNYNLNNKPKNAEKETTEGQVTQQEGKEVSAKDTLNFLALQGQGINIVNTKTALDPMKYFTPEQLANFEAMMTSFAEDYDVMYDSVMAETGANSEVASAITNAYFNKNI